MTRTASRIDEIQAEQAKWAIENFPQSQNAAQWYVPLLGVGEEAGELFHAALKYDQGIRGMSWQATREKEQDAIGDIVVYLMDFCTRRGYNFQDCVEDTWMTVRERNWKERPTTG